MGERVDVDRRRRRSARVVAGFALDDDRLAEVRRRRRTPRRTSTRTRRTPGAGCARRPGRTWRRPRTPSCRRCRARSPTRRAGRTARSARRGPRRRGASRAAGGATCRARVRAAGDERLDLLRPDLRRPAAEAAVGREQVGGMAIAVRVGTPVSMPARPGFQHCLPRAPVASSGADSLPRTCADPRAEGFWHAWSVNRTSAPTRRDRRVGHPGRRRQGQGAEGRRARTSSGSAPASPTSRRPSTSSRPRSRRAATRGTTGTRRPAGCPSCARRSPPRPSATPASTARRSQVLVTNGGKHAVFTAFAALCDPGDEVHLPGAVLDDVSRGDHARRRRARW